MIVGAALLAAACGRGDDGAGQQIKRNVQVGAFDKVAVAGSHDVIVAVGGAPSVRLEGDSKLIEKMEISVEGGTLKIRNKNKSGFSFFSHDRGTVTVYVTTPALTAASIAGSGDVKVDKVNGGDFSGAIAGSGNLEVAALQARNASFAIAGSGNVRASGKAESVEYSIAGSGDIAAGGLEARRASANIAGSGNIEGRAMDTAEIEIMGSGDVSMTGTAKCNISKKGSGEARCGG
jgi:hypothetical protein